MANGKVSINSEVVSNVLSNLSNVYSTFSSDIISSINGDFQVLTALGFTNCLSKIKNQYSSISSTQKNIIDSIASHLSEVVDTEEQLNNTFNNSYSSTSYVGDASTGFDINNEASYEIDDVNKGKKINSEELSEIISSLSVDDKKTLLNLININKNNDTSLDGLLTNYENSEELCVLLKSILNSSVEFEDFTKEETQLIQKTLLESIVSDETEYIETNTNSVLIAKEYLQSICKDYNIELIDLFNDSSYSNVLKTSLKNLYNGNVDGVLESKIIEFRDYVDKVASKNNMSSIELIENNIKLLL